MQGGSAGLTHAVAADAVLSVPMARCRRLVEGPDQNSPEEVAPGRGRELKTGRGRVACVGSMGNVEMRREGGRKARPETAVTLIRTRMHSTQEGGQLLHTCTTA